MGKKSQFLSYSYFPAIFCVISAHIMKNTLSLLLLLTAYNTTFSQSDQWISWQMQIYNTVEDVAFDCDYAWVATGYAIISYHQKTGEQHFISETNTGINGYINEIEIDQNGTKWILTTTGLYFLKNNLITKIESAIIDSALSDSYHLYNLKVDGIGNIWFSDYNHIIYKYNPISNQCTVFTLLESNSKLLLATNEIGNLYALMFNYTTGYFLYVLNENISTVAALEQLPFISKYPSSFVIDNENNFWITVGAEVSYGKDEYEINDGGILVYTNEEWNIFEPQQLTPGQTIAGYINAFKLQSGGVVLEAQSPNEFLSTQQIYKTSFNRHTATLDFEIFSTNVFCSDVEGVDYENNLYHSNLDLIKLNSNGLQDTIFLSQLKDKNSGDIYKGNNNTFWLYSFYQNLSLLQNGVFTNYDDKINKITENRLLNVLCDSINTWFIFQDIIIKYDDVSWQYFSLSSLGLTEFLSTIQQAQLDNEGNLWVLGYEILLKQNGPDWEIMNPFPSYGHYYHNFILSDSVAYLIDDDSLLVFDQNTWQVQAWGTESLPEMEGYMYSIKGANGSIFLSVNDSVYVISGTDANLFLDVNASTFAYNNITHLFSWVFGDSLYQLDQISGITNSKMLAPYHNYNTIGADNLGNILLTAVSFSPVLMYNPNGIIGHSDDILNMVDIPLANCGYYINEMQGLEIKVFPNPSTAYIDVYLSLINSGDINISIYDITGQLMASENKSSVDKGVVLLNYDVSRFTPGVYFIHVNANNQTSSLSFIRL